MRKGWKFPLAIEVAVAVLVVGAVAGACMFLRAVHYGFSAHDQPMAMEAMMAGRMRHWSVPGDMHQMRNPILLTSDVLHEAESHFADHCATCHGNDGKGQTEIGQHLYPKAPDMTLPATQSLSDGELFAIIENGVRLTGMPGWGDGTAESAYGSWTLVHFIRHLPKITPNEIEEMAKMNPITPGEMKEQMQDEQSDESFLNEGGADASSNSTQHKQ